MPVDLVGRKSSDYLRTLALEITAEGRVDLDPIWEIESGKETYT